MKIAWFSCALKAANAVGLFAAVAESPQLIVSQGDTPYIGDTMASFRGYTTVAPSVSMTLQQVLDHHYQQNADPGFQAIQAWRTVNSGVANRLYYYMPDDHEQGGDNWDHGIAQANTSPSIGAATGADCDAHWWVCMQAKQQVIAQITDNPANYDAPSVDKPAAAQAGTASSQYPVLYFRRGFSFDGVAQPLGQSGDIEVFVIDCIGGRSLIADADTASKLMLGTNQYNWLTTRLAASTATWKIIASGKETYRAGSGDNGDVWSFYSTQRNALLTYIANNSIKGVIWAAGDKHTPHVISTSVAAGDSYDHVCVVACPISVQMNGALTGALNGIVWQGPQTYASRCYGLMDLSATQAQLYIKNTSGAPLWSGRMVPTSNAMSYARQSLAV